MPARLSIREGGVDDDPQQGAGVGGVVAGDAVQDDALAAGHQGEGGEVWVGGAQARHDSHDRPLHHDAGLGHGGPDLGVVVGLHEQRQPGRGHDSMWTGQHLDPDGQALHQVRGGVGGRRDVVGTGQIALSRSSR